MKSILNLFRTHPGVCLLLATGLLLVATSAWYLAALAGAEPRTSDLKDADSKRVKDHPALLEGHDPKSTGNPGSETDQSEGANPVVVQELGRKIQEATLQLKKLEGETKLPDEEKRERARALLVGLGEALREAPADAASQAIRNYLASGNNARTGLPFTPGPGGALAEAPSVRAALLDVLGQTDPVGAVEEARRTFAGSDSPDEWALGLRALGWQNQGGEYSEEMRQRFGEMLQRPEWLSQPDSGFLEAFDAAVHLAGQPEVDRLIGVVRPLDANQQPVENGLTHAAYLALDRITTAQPEQTLGVLTQEPEALAWAPEHRAALMARADVSQPAQRQMVEAYLVTLAERPEELRTFVDLFPNRNGSLGHTLITTPPEVPGPEVIRQRDEAALSAAQAWRDDPRYASLQPQLTTVVTRLGGYLEALTAPAGSTPPQAPTANPGL